MPCGVTVVEHCRQVMVFFTLYYVLFTMYHTTHTHTCRQHTPLHSQPLSPPPPPPPHPPIPSPWPPPPPLPPVPMLTIHMACLIVCFRRVHATDLKITLTIAGHALRDRLLFERFLLALFYPFSFTPCYFINRSIG